MTRYELYLISLPDGRRYVGRSKDRTRRFDDHCKAGTLIGEAIRRYGPENCKIETIYSSCCSEDEIAELEALAIDVLRTRHPYGCNCNRGASRRILSPEARKQFLEILERWKLSVHSGDRNLVTPIVQPALESPVIAPAPKDLSPAGHNYTSGRAGLLKNIKDRSPQGKPNNPANALDTLFAPAMSPDNRPNCGWIEMTASAAGMGAIQRIFPEWVFEWERLRHPWEGWCSTVGHLPRLAAACCSNLLRSELVGSNQQQAPNDAELASLMAHAAHDEGARAAWFVSADTAAYSCFGEPAEQSTPRAVQTRQPVVVHYAPKGIHKPCPLSIVLPSQSRSSLSMDRSRTLAATRDISRHAGFAS